MLGFNRTQTHAALAAHQPLSMVELLANVTGDDTERAPEAHSQLDRLQAELADRITALDHKDGELTKRIDFLVEERRQARAVRAALLAARATAAEPTSPVSEGLLAAELDIDYTDREAYP